MPRDTGSIRAGRAFVELLANDSKLVRGLRAAQTKLKAFGAAVTGMGMKMMELGATTLTPLAGVVFDPTTDLEAFKNCPAG